MERIKEVRTVLHLSKSYEEGVDIRPYEIERIDEGRYITWYGQNTNWQFDKATNNPWTKLIDGGFEFCDEPVYEKIYNRLKNEKA